MQYWIFLFFALTFSTGLIIGCQEDQADKQYCQDVRKLMQEEDLEPGDIIVKSDIEFCKSKDLWD